MNNLKAGYARENINPPMGIPVHGYFVPRYADGILDDLEAIALALKVGEVTTLMICIDNGGMLQGLNLKYRESVSKKTGVPVE